MSPVWFVIIAGLSALLAAPVTRVAGRFAGPLLALVPAFLFISLLMQLPDLPGGVAILQTIDWVPAYGVSLGFRLDGFSLLFSLLITGIGTLVVIYAGSYFSGEEAKDRGRFLGFILLFMTAMLGTVLADDLIMLFIFWEMTSLVSFFLIGFKHEDAKARKAALQSLVVTAGGGLALLGGIIILGLTAGTFSLTGITAQAPQIANSPAFPAIIVLVLIGCFTKSAQFPFHFWLPNAMAAPTPASAYLHSATMVKLGVYLLARFDTGFGEFVIFYAPLMVFGGVTMLISAFAVMRSTGFKAVLAWSTVCSLATLVLLVGVPGLDGVKATIGFLVAHALYKAALFFAAGQVIHSTHQYELARLGGLRFKLPITAVASILAAISMAGVPFFLGYKAKDLFLTATLGGGDWAIWLTFTALASSAVMTAVAGLAALRPFFIKPPYGEVKVYHGEYYGMALPPLMLGLLGLAIGVIPALFWDSVLTPAISALYGGAVTLDVHAMPSLGPKFLFTLGLLLAGAALVWLWLRLYRDPDAVKPNMVFADLGYGAVMGALDRAGRVSARVLQALSLRTYIAVTLGFSTLALLLALSGFSLDMISAAAAEPLRPYMVVVLLLTIVGSAVAALSRSVLISILGVGIVGYTMAVVFLLNGAPDVAFTQFTVETLSIVILLAVLLRLSLQPAPQQSLLKRPLALAISAGFGIAVGLGVMAMSVLPFDSRLSDFFGEASYVEANGHNVVNVILVDFRALDTLGEISVVALATLCVWALLRRRVETKG
ncbi:MAG: hydrogen gas-evolving membrane-bound hydrogenase subunit E [Caulobacterales bacterium]|uniref:hydrogen gas-evolving membrane-bound hydrogenase subunit E n=1 Tax=Glycocaulis sp. TaxID=1969725 RepID=UPI003F9F2242